MKHIFGLTRFVVILGVISSLILAIVLFAYGLFEAFRVVARLVFALGDEHALKEAAVSAIQLADIALIAAALYIIAAGLYGLFVGKPDLPAWLIIHTFEELKDKLLGVSVAVLAVTFVEYVATWDSQSNLLTIGLSIAAVVIAVGAYIFLSHRSGAQDVPRTDGKQDD